MLSFLFDCTVQVCLIALLQTVIISAYIIPKTLLTLYSLTPRSIKYCLDYAYLRSHWLQSVFTFHFDCVGQSALAPTYLLPSTPSTIDILANNCALSVTPLQLQTDDGYILTLHRLTKVSSNPHCDNGTSTKQPVLIIHGLLMSSDSVLCGGKSSLAHYLSSLGFDVFLGNNRGNKYSCMHKKLKPKMQKFWDYSLDEFAKYDVPAMIKFILHKTGNKKLSIVGFSQGSAQVFAALSLDNTLCDSINVFIALSPAAKPRSFSNPHLSYLFSNAPYSLLRFLFGSQKMFNDSVFMWQKVLSPKLFAAVVSTAMNILFGWQCTSITPHRRTELFQHIFSDSSVKSVAHWFHIMKQEELCSFTNARLTYLSSFWSLFSSKARESDKYDISTITCPVAVFAGGKDYLIDPYVVQQRVKTCILTHIQEGFEHLDLIWADRAADVIFPDIKLLLNRSFLTSKCC